MLLPRTKCQTSVLQNCISQKSARVFLAVYSSLASTQMPSSQLRELRTIVSSSIGSLDDLEARLGPFAGPLTSPIVAQIIDSCKTEAPTRRLLRFFLWSSNTLKCRLEDQHFNHAVRVFAEKKDFTAMDILVSDLLREGRAMESQTFSIVAETLVKLGKENQAMRIFNSLDKFKCPIDKTAVVAVINALCAEGHARKAEGVLVDHRGNISGVEACIYKNLLYGWSVQKNAKEARRILRQMKCEGLVPDLFCYNMLLRCLCEHKHKSNPSGLVPEALDVMVEMRTNNISPTCESYNVLLSCLCRTRRVKESCNILVLMKKSGCSPDWVSYYLVVRVLFLSKRFGKGKQIAEEMIAEGLIPQPKFYHDLIGVLCRVEMVNYAVDLFQQMKDLSLGHYGPVYNLLIPELCSGGYFEKGRELWDEAVKIGVILTCSSDLLDPSVTEVFRPTKKVEGAVPPEDTETKYQSSVKKGASKGKRTQKKWIKNQQQKKKKKKKKNAG